jgi:excisionase family DNA binding protein
MSPRSAGLPPSPTFSVQECCDYVGFKRTKCFALIKSGSLRVCKIGRRTFILRESVEALLLASTVPAPAGSATHTGSGQ